MRDVTVHDPTKLVPRRVDDAPTVPGAGVVLKKQDVGPADKVEGQHPVAPDADQAGSSVRSTGESAQLALRVKGPGRRSPTVPELRRPQTLTRQSRAEHGAALADAAAIAALLKEEGIQ